MIKLSVIIPTYNEKNAIIEKTVNDIIRGIESSCDAYEIIIVDDGSQLKIEIPTSENVCIVRHTINKGYGSSIKTGIKLAQYDWIAITDADGTYPNDYFDKLISHTDNYDMIIGCRDIKKIPFMRRFPKWILRMLASYLTEQKIKDLNSGMRLFKKGLAMEFFKLFPNRFSLTSTITMAAHTNGYEVLYVPIPYFNRIGKSHISPIKDTIRFFYLIIRLTLYFNPLRFFIPLSFIMLILAVSRGIRDYLIVHHIGGMSLVLFFMCFQIFFFGLIAEIINKK